jgi:uncharacterized membrane protein
MMLPSRKTSPAAHGKAEFDTLSVMLAVIGVALCVLLAIGIAALVRSRHTRATDRAMRDYIRRAY